MSSLWYFIHDIILFPDQHKKRYNPSRLVYYAPFLIFEFVITILITIYLFPQLPQQPSYYTILLFIIWFIMGTIVITLCLDLFGIIRMCIVHDLTRCLECDFKNKSAQYGADYMYYQEITANGRFLQLNEQTMCTICRNNYVDDPMVYDKSLLDCGHLFHTKCIRFNENYHWKHNIFQHSMSRCPQDQFRYHAPSQRYDYDENYWSKIPGYLTPFDYFGRETTDLLYWGAIHQEYAKYRDQRASSRPGFEDRTWLCLYAVILNIYNLIIKFAWKCIRFLLNSMKNIKSIISRFFNGYQSLLFGNEYGYYMINAHIMYC